MFNQYVCYEIFTIIFVALLINISFSYLIREYSSHVINIITIIKKGVMVNFPDIKIVFNIISHSQTLLKKGGEREDICSK